jgi:transcriptional regulator with XRE-family HTH domain
MEVNMENLAEQIRRLRRKKGYTQYQLSVKSGISQQQISQIEAGFVKIPHLPRLQKLAEALSTDVSALAQSAGIQLTPAESPEELLNRAIVSLPHKLLVINDVRTEEETRESVWLPRKAGVEMTAMKAIKVKADWDISEAQEISKGDLLIVDKSLQPLNNNGKFSLCIYFDSKMTYLKYSSGDPPKGLALYGVVIRSQHDHRI